MKNLIRKVTDAIGWTVPAFNLEVEKADRKPGAYVPPERLGQFYLINTRNDSKTLVQIEREMNPSHNHYGKEFFAVKPGMKWLRAGFYSANRDKCWINLFKEFKDRKVTDDEGNEETKRTKIAELAEAFVQCASKEAGGVWEDYELEPFTAKERP